MKFYIVTPTFNALHWLQRCIRSVADQVTEGIEVHHHIQDGGSTDETTPWLQHWQNEHLNTPGYTFTYTSAKDAGMYDALNKAWDILPDDADITAHLNSDEQYMPQALANLARAFTGHPKADAIVATYLVLDEQNRYICHRRPVKPKRLFSQAICEITTCACFIRTHFFRKAKLRFDTNYRSLADLIFYRDLMNARARVETEPEILSSIYIVTGSNISWSNISNDERARIINALPAPLRLLRPLIIKWHNLKRIGVDKTSTTPQNYWLYHNAESLRSEHRIQHPRGVWKTKSTGENNS